MNFLIEIILLIAGFVLLIKGADWFVEGASKIADKFGIPQIIIGLTIVAMGTSAPEAAISISAAIKGSAAIAIGNIVGSNILNVLLILGITSIIIPLTLQKATAKIEIPFVIIISILLPLLGLLDGTIGRIDALILLGLFGVFLFYLFKTTIKGKGKPPEGEIHSKEHESLLKLSFFILSGMVLIVVGSDISVDAASELARLFGLSERLIGLTIVALGTSLPELITSVTAAKKGKSDIAIGNIVGSNIFNILFVLGITGVIIPVPYSSNFLVDSIVCLFAMVLLSIAVWKNHQLNRKAGILMLICYAGYFVYLVQGV